MKQRIITGIILLLLIIPTVIFSGTYFLNILIGILSLAGTYEMLGCIKSRSKKLLSLPSYIFALIMPLMASLDSKYMLFTAVIYAFYIFSVSVFTNGEADTSKVATVFGTVFYITAGFCGMIRSRVSDNGLYLFILIFVAAWVTDSAAYFSGRFFGKRKLCVQISPKKTVEGAIGGTVVNMIFFVIFGVVVHNITDMQANYLSLIVFGLVTALVAQLGDLVMSAIKRNYKIKDYGTLFPGHGGVLDRFDSILSVAPFVCMLSNVGIMAIFK